MIIIRIYKLLIVSLVANIVVSTSAVAVSTESASKDAQRFALLYDYALISNAAYYGLPDVSKRLTASGYVLSLHGEIPGYGVGYFLATNHKLKQQIIVVRGTSNVENAMVDIAFNLLPNKHIGIKLHQGFALTADLIYTKVKAGLIKGYQINTTGHSLGGAAAVILAMYIDSAGFNVGKVITFGQPKVTNIRGSQKYSHLNIYRVVMPKDVVPLVPPMDPMDVMNMDIYWHLGTEVILQNGNTYSVLEGMESMMRATDFLNEAISEANLQQHYMTLYIKYLSTLKQNAQRVPYKSNFNIMDFFSGSTAN